MPEITKTVRFEIFKRDSFACQYCGATPPAVVLEIDHVIPKAKGGVDDFANLITACFSCNRGKGARPLDCPPQSLNARAAEIAEAEAQLAAYTRLLQAKARRENSHARAVEAIFRARFTDRQLTPRFRNQIKKTFLRRLPVSELVEAMEISCAQPFNPDRTIKYFCGICWRKIKDDSRG